MMTNKQKANALIAGVFVVGAIFGGYVNEARHNWFEANHRVVEENYVVQPGDTFWGIAEHYRAKDCRNPYVLEFKSELESLNKRVYFNGGQVQVGDVIKIRYYEEIK